MGKVVEMPVSGADKYITACLTKGKTLSHCVLATCRFDDGKAITCLPEDVDRASLHRFEVGGVIQGDESAREGPSANDLWLADKIRSFLKQRSTNLCIFEHALAKRGDPWLALRKAQIFTFRDEVYHYLLHKDSGEQTILKTIRDATSHIFIGIMSSSPQERFLRQEEGTLTMAQLRLWAERTEKIIVGAYDCETYLIWERR